MLLSLISLFASFATPSAPAPRPTVAASHCRAGEALLYSCRFGRRIGSVCGSEGKVHYRFGPPGRPEIDLASRPDWSNVRTGYVVGQGGGYQSHLRLTRGRYHYVLFHGQDGSLALRPGRTYSGITVLDGRRDHREIGSHRCRGGERGTDRSWEEALRPHLPAELKGEVPRESEGSLFDGWF